jgi:hypothetical protein
MKQICAMSRTPIGIDMGRRWTALRRTGMRALQCRRSVSGACRGWAYPEGRDGRGCEVAPNGCEIGAFLHASEILACGDSDCNSLEDLSNFWVTDLGILLLL